MTHRLLVSLVACSALGACGSPPPPAATPTNRPPPTVDVPRVAGDLDGDGAADAATIDLVGQTVAAGGLTFRYAGLPGIGEAGDEIVAARVIDVGPEALVALEHRTIEDDQRWELLAVRGGVLTLLGKVFIGGGEPTLPGNGTMIITHANCGQRVTTTVTVGDVALDMRDDVVGTYDNDDCAACPYVFQFAGGVGAMRGESLRNLVGADAEATDELALAPAADGVVTVQLAEVKPETTYLDRIALRVDGGLIAPRECAGGGPACADDGVFDTFSIGARRTFTFDVPPGAEVTLVTTGYYLPQITR